eukprot:6461702-Amphidinium_carterae.1
MDHASPVHHGHVGSNCLSDVRGQCQGARQEHEKWLDMSPEEQAGMERTYVLGSINPVPQAPDTVTAHMRVDLLEA